MKFFPLLIQVNRRLGHILAKSLLNPIITDSDEKRLFAFFFGKAVKTHQAILLLGENGFGEDASLLLRSLLNLVINAKWIHQNTETRIPSFINYNSVLKAKLNRKFVQNPKLLGRDNQHLLDQFRDEQAELDSVSQEMSERYGYNRHGWSGKSIREMAADIKLVDSYDSAYNLISNIEHSNIESVNVYTSVGDDGLILDIGPRPDWVKETVLSAQLLLLDLAELANEILELDIYDELLSARREAKNLINSGEE